MKAGKWVDAPDKVRVDLLGGRTVRWSASVNRPVTQLAGNEEVIGDNWRATPQARASARTPGKVTGSY